MLDNRNELPYWFFCTWYYKCVFIFVNVFIQSFRNFFKKLIYNADLLCISEFLQICIEYKNRQIKQISISAVFSQALYNFLLIQFINLQIQIQLNIHFRVFYMCTIFYIPTKNHTKTQSLLFTVFQSTFIKNSFIFLLFFFCPVYFVRK